MRNTEELFEIDVAAVLRETAKAVQVRTLVGTEHWIPRSQIRERTGESMLVPMWWAERSKVAKHIEEASN